MHGIWSGSRPEVDPEKERAKIKEYRDSVRDLQAKMRRRDLNADTLSGTSKLLSRNPEYYTVWNYRRRILTSTFENLDQTAVEGMLAKDLQFLVPLLRLFPKCYWIWNYRLWLFQQAEARLSTKTSFAFWQAELDLIDKMLARDSRNFHGWDYRRTVIAQLEAPLYDELRSGSGDVESAITDVTSGDKSMTELEFAYTTKMIKKNLSNFSAWHYRSKLIPRLLAERKASSAQREKFLDEEFDLIHDALCDPWDRSIWLYHQYLMKNLLPPSSTAANAIVPDSLDYRSGKLDTELEYVQEVIDDEPDCKEALQAMVQYVIALPKGHESRTERRQRAREFITQLKMLDPLRQGKWEEAAAALADA